MGYKYGVWMTYEHSLLQTSHIKHVTIACLMTKENALKLYDEIVNKYGDTFEVLLHGKHAFYDAAFYEHDTNKTCSWGFDGTCDMWDTFKTVCDNYKCDFSYIPQTSIDYGISPNLLKPYSINNVKIQCKVHCADIRSDFPEDWKLIDSK